jgi:hypothetical protein
LKPNTNPLFEILNYQYSTTKLRLTAYNSAGKRQEMMIQMRGRLHQAENLGCLRIGKAVHSSGKMFRIYFRQERRRGDTGGGNWGKCSSMNDFTV